MRSGAVSHCQFVAVSEATGELRPARQQGFDTRRSRCFKFISSQRRIRHVRKPHEYRVKRRETVVNHAFFIAGNGGRAVGVATVKTCVDL